MKQACRTRRTNTRLWAKRENTRPQSEGEEGAHQHDLCYHQRGKVRFTIYREAMTQVKLIAFMCRLARDAGRKVYLILDNLKAHHGKKVAEWLEAQWQSTY